MTPGGVPPPPTGVTSLFCIPAEPEACLPAWGEEGAVAACASKCTLGLVPAHLYRGYGAAIAGVKESDPLGRSAAWPARIQRRW